MVPFDKAVLVAVEINYYTVPFVKAGLVAVRSLNIRFLLSRLFRLM